MVTARMKLKARIFYFTMALLKVAVFASTDAGFWMHLKIHTFAYDEE